MSRRRKTTPLEDLIELAALLPWWLGLILAFAAYLLLNSYATSSAPVVTNPQQFAYQASGMVFRGFAMAFQYIVPFALVIGAAASFFGRLKRKKLVADVANARESGRTVDGISWREFEQLVGEVFRRKGFSVTETGGNGPDGGVDLVLQMGSDKYLVQCKQWKAIKVGVTVIREFFGVMAAQGAAGGFVVTSGTYTDEAKAFAEGRNIQLVDGVLLKRWIANRTVSEQSQPEQSAQPASPQVKSAPLCPVCNSVMQVKTAKRGAYVGNEFWGCPKFPGCRGTRNISA
ncbi:restriction endonuclease [Pseudomonas knackmussii]|uniref:restriction endonuclease n=1 Tax=Pseudomonas knackmussii TaxID=65741 RepID=UPI003F4A69C4